MKASAKTIKKNPFILVILDGFGLPTADPGLKNAIREAQTPHFDELFEKYPHSMIHTSGEEVGLPPEQMGNSEVGHLNIGAGRVIYSDMIRISKALESGDFAQNTAFKNQMKALKERNAKLHLMGLLSDGGVHSHIEHLKSILRICKEDHPDVRVCLHAFLDGRDTAPTSGAGFIREIQSSMLELSHGSLASVVGRYYAMDRDQRWERIQRAYELIVEGKGEPSKGDPVREVEGFYQREITDEFMEPILCDPSGLIQEGDGVLFFNFRADRARQLSRALTGPQFSEFRPKDQAPKKNLKLHFTCLTEYDAKMNLPVLFPPSNLKNILGEVIAGCALKQLRLAETEKYAHVTFFFNGGVEKPFENEDRILIPSPKVATYDLKPEMSAVQVKDELIRSIRAKKYSLIVVNFANGDMVGHTGDLAASIQAVETLDLCMGEIREAVTSHDAQMLVTADHGNCEQMLAHDGKTPFTQHTTGPVPLIYVAPEIPQSFSIKDGKLADIAPTVLSLMGIDIPPEMTGEVLTAKEVE